MKKFTQRLFLTCLLSALCVVVQAQAFKNASGTIRDESGHPVEGASVSEKGMATNGTVTDKNGDFTLPLKGRANAIVISFIGYQTLELKVSNSPVHALLKLLQSTNDVVVIGYQSQKRRNVTAAVSSISGRDIKDIPEASFDQMLQGRLAGVNVLSSSGELGARPNIVIRGATNVDFGNGNGGNSGPLYVIDGVIYDINNIGSSYNANNPITGAVTSANPLSLINPNDIESIDILKDASASAIYGARAGNGVIIVRTKRAKQGKPQITISAFAGVSNRPNFREVVVGAAERALKLNLLHNYLPYNNLQTTPAPIQLTDSLNPAFNNNIDWQGLMVRDRAMVNSQDVSVAGIAGGTTYRLSFNHYKEQGVLNGFSLERFAPHLTLGIRPVKGMSISTDILISAEQRKHGVGGSTGALFNSWDFPSSFPQLSATQLAAYKGDGDFYDEHKIFAMTASVNLLDTILPNLTFNSNFSSTSYTDRYDYLSPILINNTENTAYHNESTNPGWSFENYLTYTKTIKEHHFAIAAGTSAYSNRNYSTNAWAKGINITGINTIQTIPSGPNLFVSTQNQRKTTASYYGRLIYDYDGKYLLTASVRRDASSIYSSNYQWGTFPSVSIGWIPSEEKFFQPVKGAINFLKLRASYGVTGNDPGSWYAKYQNLFTDASFGTATTGTLAPWGDLVGTPSTYNGTAVISPYPYDRGDFNAGVSASNSVRWERYPQIDLGADIEFFNSRINLAVDWYQKDAKDKYFYNIPAQVTTGYAYYSGNSVDVRNRGLEISVNTRNMSQRSAFQWNTNFNISFNQNYVTRLPNNNRDFLFGVPWFQQTLTIGEPLFNYKVWDVTGVYPTDDAVPVDHVTGNRLSFFGSPLKAGDAAYVDYNGDYVIDNEDKVIAGNPMPKVTGGFGNTFSYKGFSLNIFCSFITGRNIFNGYLSDYLNGSRDYGSWGRNSGPAAITGILDQFWYQTGQSTRFPRLVYPTTGTAGQDPWHIAHSYFVENGDFLKVKQATLAYNLPDKWIRNLKMKRLNVYGMAENLLTLKRSKVVPDPELVDPTTGSANVVYPTAMKFTLGFNVEF